MYANVRDVKFKLKESILIIGMDKPIKGNLSDTFMVNIVQQSDNLEDILNLLLQDLP